MINMLCELPDALFFSEISNAKEKGSGFIGGKINLLGGTRLCCMDHRLLTPVPCPVWVR